MSKLYNGHCSLSMLFFNLEKSRQVIGLSLGGLAAYMSQQVLEIALVNPFFKQVLCKAMIQ